MTGHERLQAVVATVRLVVAHGGKPAQVLIHPDDFFKLSDHLGQPIPVTTATVEGLPLVLDWDCPLGQVQVTE